MNQENRSYRTPHVILLTLIFFAIAAVGPAQEGRDFANPKQWRWPIAMDGKAHEIRLNAMGIPVLNEVSTQLPLVTYGGKSADGKHLAYLSLAAADVTAPLGRRAITQEARTKAPVSLVPTGELIIESLGDGAIRKIETPGQYVISVAWSPVDGRLLAYTFSSGSTMGIAVLDLQEGTPVTVESSDVLADFLRWSPSGNELDYYKRDRKNERIGSNGYVEAVFAEKRYSILAAKAANPSEQGTWPFQLPRLRTSTEDSTLRQGFRSYLNGGFNVSGDNILGLSKLVISTDDNQPVASADAHQLVVSVPTGVIYRQIVGESIKVKFLGIDGRSRELANLVTTTYDNLQATISQFLQPRP